jgi:hypothetical protein
MYLHHAIKKENMALPAAAKKKDAAQASLIL